MRGKYVLRFVMVPPCQTKAWASLLLRADWPTTWAESLTARARVYDPPSVPRLVTVPFRHTWPAPPPATAPPDGLMPRESDMPRAVGPDRTLPEASTCQRAFWT